MDLEREPQPQTHGGAADSEDATLSDDEWPVDEHYFVEPVPAPVQAELESIRREEPGPSRDPRGRSRVPLALLLVLLALLALLALSVAWIVGRDDPSQATPLGRMPSSSAGATGQTPTSTTSPATPASAVSVPQVNGLQLADARARLEKAGFRVRVRSRTSDAPQNQVLEQSPAASSKVASKSFVVLTVGKGSKRVVVPSLVGLTADAASRKIRGRGRRGSQRNVGHDQGLDRSRAGHRAFGRRPRRAVRAGPARGGGLRRAGGRRVDHRSLPGRHGDRPGAERRH